MPSLPERMADFYSALDTQGCAALERLESLYAPNVHYVDPTHDIRGLDELRYTLTRLYTQNASVRFPEVAIIGDDAHFMGTWTMRMRPKIGPEFTIFASSDFVTEAGLVVRQRNYWDGPSAFLATMPLLVPIYRKVMTSLFG